MASEEKQSPPVAPATKSKPRPKRKRNPSATKPRRLPPYNVVLLNDDDHTYDYVIEMLGKLFAYPIEKAFKLAKEVDTAGRVILLTTTKEHAEFKQEQIHAYGRDTRIQASAGSMSAIIEPAVG